MSRQQLRETAFWTVLRTCVAAGFIVSAPSVVAAQSPAPQPVPGTVRASAAPAAAGAVRFAPGAPLAAAERAALVRRILADPKAADIRSDRVRALSVVPSIPDKEVEGPHANAILFDYTNGRAFRASLNADGLVRLEALPGRPTASDEEIAEARALVMRNADNAALVRRGAVLDGGFVVDPPAGADPRGRYLQLYLLTPDRTRFVRGIVVDLSAQRLVSSRAQR